MTPEQIFFAYAFPCLEFSLLRGVIDQKEYERLLKMRQEEKAPTKEDLIKFFPNAYAEIKKLFGENCWEIKNIRRYFQHEHNKLIDGRCGVYALPFYDDEKRRNHCQVRIGKIIGFKKCHGKMSFSVDFGDSVEKVVADFLPKAKIKDRIAVHYQIAIEVV